MKKILFILCLFSMTAHAEEVTPMEGVTIIENPKETNPLSNLSKYNKSVICSSAIQTGSVAIMIQQKNAPSYAQEKYEKQIKFYGKALSNIKRDAQKTKEFQTVKFEEDINKTNKSLLATLKNKPDNGDGLIGMIGDCFKFAGMNMADFPK